MTQLEDIIQRLDYLEARVETLSRRQMEKFGGSASSLVEGDMALFEALKDWRKRRAAELGVPVYVVIPDEALTAIAVTKPTDAYSMSHIKGMGPKRVEGYADDVIGIVRQHSVGDW